MGRYAKDRLNAAYIRLTQRTDGYTVLEVPTTVSRDIYLDGNRAVLSDAQVMLGPLFSEPGSAILNFDDPISRNVLVTGSLTEGTMLLRALWYQLIRQNRPSDLRFVVIDTGGTLPTSVHNSAHLLFTPILNTHNPGESTNSDLRQFEMRQALQAVAHEIHRRQTGASARPRWVVMITEIADLLQRKGLLRLLDHILQQGRQARIHVVACTARVEPVVLQHDLVQRYFQARLVGQMPDSARSELACGGPDYHAEWSLGNGDFTYTHTNQRFQCGIVSDSELKYLPRAVALPDVWSIAAA
jgi:DNA segregation ATPase FtsK/SpoIIIE-like protein